MDADKTLLGCMDEASSLHNMHFNSAVTRRALKQLMYDDLKLCAFSEMADSTYNVIASRYMQDEEDGDLTADDFYSMTCCQVLAKLLKNIQSKVRSKDST